jgi:hypothetical protein
MFWHMSPIIYWLAIGLIGLLALGVIIAALETIEAWFAGFLEWLVEKK